MSSQSSHKGFDLLAPIYDILARIVFGKAIRTAQLYFLDHIPKPAKALILGGGSGWVLEALLRKHPDTEVTYIEASRKMIERAKARLPGAANVHFLLGTQADIDPNESYDVVFTQFFLDLFKEDDLNKVMTSLCSVMTPKGHLLFTDFQHRDIGWQKVLLRSMYVFFKVCCHIEGDRLPHWELLLAHHGLSKVRSGTFYHEMILSGIWTIGTYTQSEVMALGLNPK